MNELFEKLAAIEHERWADWQKYVHSQCVNHDAEWVLCVHGSTCWRGRFLFCEKCGVQLTMRYAVPERQDTLNDRGSDQYANPADAGQISTPIAENDNTDVLVDRELVPEGPAPVPDKQESK